jgi:hypothetical protein
MMAMAVAASFVPRSVGAGVGERTDEYHGTFCQLTFDAASHYRIDVNEDGASIVVLPSPIPAPTNGASFICPVNVSSDYDEFKIKNVHFEVTMVKPGAPTPTPTCTSTLVSPGGHKNVFPYGQPPNNLPYIVDHAYLFCTLPVAATGAINGYKVFMTYVDV